MTIQKPKASIQDIPISRQTLAKLDTLLKSNRSRAVKDLAIRRAAGGRCCRCTLIPTKIVKYHLDGITLAERYCGPCYDKVKGELA
jgi:hypothetical protein